MSHFFQTIKFKIFLAFGICIALMTGLGSFGLHGISELNDNIRLAYEENTIPTAQIGEVGLAQSELRRMLWMATALEDKGQGSHLRGEIARVMKAWQVYYPDLATIEREKATAQRLDRALKDMAAMAEQEVALLEAGEFQKAGMFQKEKLAPVAESAAVMIREIVDINLAHAKEYTTTSRAHTVETIWVTAILLAVGVALSAGTGVYLMRAITVPLNRTVDIADRIAAGDLSRSIVVDRQGEFGQLLQAMRAMAEQLGTTVRNIKVSTESVRHASKEIAHGNMDLSARTEAQAASLEETAASMTELSQTVRLNADNAMQANSLASNARDMADASNQAVQAMVGTIGRISTSSDKISDITSLIEGIAFQTNILALNAAVEAARAGEQGRGFAVVAGEVRALAQRSSAAAKEIKDLIESSSAMVRDGSKQASEVGDTMAQVIRAIKQVSDIVGEISAASAEQSQGIDQVHQAVSQIDAVTQQNAALVEESAAAAQALEQEASRMAEAVAVFRLDLTHGSAGALPQAALPSAMAASATSRPVTRPSRKAPQTAARPPKATRPAAAKGQLALTGTGTARGTAASPAASGPSALSASSASSASSAPAAESHDNDDWQAF